YCRSTIQPDEQGLNNQRKIDFSLCAGEWRRSAAKSDHALCNGTISSLIIKGAYTTQILQPTPLFNPKKSSQGGNDSIGRAKIESSGEITFFRESHSLYD